MKKTHIAIGVLILTLGSIVMEACQSSVCDCCEKILYSIKDLTMGIAQQGTAPKSLLFIFDASQHEAAQANNDQKRCVTIMAMNYSKEKFTSLKIVSNSKLITSDSRTFNAGDDLTPVFLLNNFKIGQQLHMQTFNFSPNFSVPEKTNHQFTFTITLDDGRTFELKSGELEIAPD